MIANLTPIDSPLISTRRKPMSKETIEKAAQIGSVVLSGVLLTLQIVGLFKSEDKAPQHE